VPVEAPEGTAAFPTLPELRKTWVLIVGFPLESRISLALISVIAVSVIMELDGFFIDVSVFLLRMNFF
jgi:hypothetical protein